MLNNILLVFADIQTTLCESEDSQFCAEVPTHMEPNAHKCMAEMATNVYVGGPQIVMMLLTPFGPND